MKWGRCVMIRIELSHPTPSVSVSEVPSSKFEILKDLEILTLFPVGATKKVLTKKSSSVEQS